MGFKWPVSQQLSSCPTRVWDCVNCFCITSADWGTWSEKGIKVLLVAKKHSFTMISIIIFSIGRGSDPNDFTGRNLLWCQTYFTFSRMRYKNSLTILSSNNKWEVIFNFSFLKFYPLELLIWGEIRFVVILGTKAIF